MLIRTYERKDLNAYAPEHYGLPGDAVFFDIETTGLSSSAAQLYLIGALTFEDGLARTTQWFAESFLEERALLAAFSEYLKGHSTLVSYNGDSFDVHFLRDLEASYGLPSSFDGIESLDLMKVARSSRRLTGLTSFRQKNVEAYLGIGREDLYNGGELIPIYQRFVLEHREEDLHVLLLHNREDVDALPALLPMLHLKELLEKPVFQDLFVQPGEGAAVEICGTLPYELPKPLDFYFSDGSRFLTNRNSFRLVIPVFQGILRLYYQDYRSYDFLPIEGYAVHHKLSRFIDGTRKVPATRETAYMKEKSIFIPAPVKSRKRNRYQTKYAAKEHYYRLQDLDPESYLLEEWAELKTKQKT